MNSLGQQPDFPISEEVEVFVRRTSADRLLRSGLGPTLVGLVATSRTENYGSKRICNSARSSIAVFVPNKLWRYSSKSS